MKHKSILGIKLIVLSLLFFSTLGSRCNEGGDIEETPADSAGCGHGEGHYGVGINSGPPSSFNCNLQGNFQMEFYPSIHESYGGFNRFYFELKKGSSVYRSNYVEFDSGYWGVEQLEWGGSLPSGEYRITGVLENIQLNSTCEDSIYKDDKVDLGSVDITQFSNPQKTMMIEYFSQYSDIGDIDRYCVFLSPNTQEYIDIAFNIANTTYNLMPYGLHLEPELVVFTQQRIKEYILDNKNYDWHMFLCGIKGFKDIDGYSMPDQLGVTYEDDWLTCAPSESTGSLVAVKTCIDYAASDEYRMDYNDLVTGMTIHELGLQRGAVDDEHIYTWPSPKFCVGHLGLIHWEASQDEPHPHLFVTHWNPHFCDQCITGIKNITW